MIQSKFKTRCSVEDSKGARHKKMKFEREKLVPWLIQKVDSGEVPGLYWLDEERTEFRITWKHAGKPDFELEKDAVLFRMWAEHTGKYKPGEQPDPSTWKTRFRCALRKMPDIEEIRVLHSLDKKEPYRVFRLKSKVSKSQSKSGAIPFSVLDTPSPSPTNDAVEGLSSFSSMPATSHQYNELSSYNSMTCNPAVDVSSFPSPNSSHTSHASDISNSSLDSVFTDEEDDINNINPTLPPLTAETYQHNDFRMINNEFGNDLSCSNTNFGYCPMVNESYSQSLPNFTERSVGFGYGGGGSGAGVYQGIPHGSMTSNAENLDQDCDGSNTSPQMGLFLKMLHDAATAMETDFPVRLPNSCSEKLVLNDTCKLENIDCHLSARISYEERQIASFKLGKQNSTWRVFYGEHDNHLYGTSDVKQIQLPEAQCSNETQRVLANFSRGLLLEMTNDGDIWATRKSMTKVFFSSGSTQSTKLDREVKTKVFDLSEFQQTLQNSHKGTCVLPPCDVTFTLGWPNGLMVCIVITHALAKKMLLDTMIGVQLSASDPTNDQLVFDFAGQFVGTVLLDNRDSIFS